MNPLAVRHAAVLGLLLTAGTASGQLGPLFGGGAPPERREAPLDPRLPRGRLMRWTARPPTSAHRICSLRRPLCVHAPGPAGPSALAWLEALEAAHEGVVDVVGAPPPLSDFDAGGGPELDLYLTPDASALSVEADAHLAVDRDASSAWCRVGEAHPARGRVATRCVGGAIAVRLDAAEPDAARGALAEHLWLATGAPTSEDVTLLDDAQRRPDAPLLSGNDEGPTTLLYGYLDGRDGTGTVPLALHALAANAASPGPRRFDDEPDVWDVFRSSYGPKPTRIAAAITGFSVARALVGRGSGAEAAEATSWLSVRPRVAFDWSIALSSLPRRLMTRRPVGPLGATYTWVDVDEPTRGTTLALQAEWEGPVAFAWSLVTVSRDGRLLARYDAPYVEGARKVERTVVDLGGASGVIVVGTNLGAIGATYPYDPDFSPHEPHAATVYLAKLGQ